MPIYLRFYSADQFCKVSAVFLLHTTLVDDWVQRVPHLMRYGWIDQWREIVLSFHVVIEDLRGDIDELKKVLLLSSFLDVDAFLYLEVREAGKVFLWYIHQVWSSINGLLDFSVGFPLHKSIDFLFEGEYFLADLILRETYDVLKGVCFLLWHCVFVIWLNWVIRILLYAWNMSTFVFIKDLKLRHMLFVD